MILMLFHPNRYDKVHNIRKNLVEALRKEFADYGLT